jgi:hypothetical protein
MRDTQALHPNYRSRLCRYCGGRGFTLVEQVDPKNPDKEVWNNVVIECKFCGGEGISKPRD